METIIGMIRNGLKQNTKELKSEIIEFKSYQENLKKDKSFDFNITISYRKDIDLLELYYTIKNKTHEITIKFLMNELTFNFNCYEITSNLLKYAESYFNNSEFKINIGSFDGDYYVNIIEYIKSFSNSKVNLSIYDETLDINIY